MDDGRQRSPWHLSRRRAPRRCRQKGHAEWRGRLKMALSVRGAVWPTGKQLPGSVWRQSTRLAPEMHAPTDKEHPTPQRASQDAAAPQRTAPTYSGAHQHRRHALRHGANSSARLRCRQPALGRIPPESSRWPSCRLSPGRADCAKALRLRRRPTQGRDQGSG